MRHLLRKKFLVEYSLNAEVTAGISWQFRKEYRTMAGAQSAVTLWFNKSGRGGMAQITRIGDRV